MTGKQHLGMAIAVAAFSGAAYCFGYVNGAAGQADYDYDAITGVMVEAKRVTQQLRHEITADATVSHQLRMAQAENRMLKLFNSKEHPPIIEGRDTLWTMRARDWRENEAVFDRPLFYKQDSLRLQLE